jgi:predicted transcriptional regulator
MPTLSEHTLYVRVPNEVIRQLQRVADRECNGLSAVARRILTAGLAREQLREPETTDR